MLGIRRSSGELELQHEEAGIECWCRPLVVEEGQTLIVIHNSREETDA